MEHVTTGQTGHTVWGGGGEQSIKADTTCRIESHVFYINGWLFSRSSGKLDSIP